MNGRTLTLASNNRHKIEEIRAILGPSWTVRGVGDVKPGLKWDETGDTFKDNARIKIAALRPFTAGCVIADDSGLCVDALGGRPGVHSSGFGGVEGDHPRNVERLLRVMNDVPDSDRGAHFYCLILVSDEEGREHSFEGKCFGRISRTAHGKGGFGYDPVFIPDGFNCSMAEMSEAQKNEISHRGRAMAEFMRAFASG